MHWSDAAAQWAWLKTANYSGRCGFGEGRRYDVRPKSSPPLSDPHLSPLTFCPFLSQAIIDRNTQYSLCAARPNGQTEYLPLQFLVQQESSTPHSTTTSSVQARSLLTSPCVVSCHVPCVSCRVMHRSDAVPVLRLLPAGAGSRQLHHPGLLPLALARASTSRREPTPALNQINNTTQLII